MTALPRTFYYLGLVVPVSCPSTRSSPSSRRLLLKARSHSCGISITELDRRSAPRLRSPAATEFPALANHFTTRVTSLEGITLRSTDSMCYLPVSHSFQSTLFKPIDFPMRKQKLSVSDGPSPWTVCSGLVTVWHRLSSDLLASSIRTYLDWSLS